MRLYCIIEVNAKSAVKFLSLFFLRQNIRELFASKLLFIIANSTLNTRFFCEQMVENALEEFRDGVRKGAKSTLFQILAEIHKELADKPNESVYRHFWKRFRLVGYSKIRRGVNLYLLRLGFRAIGPERFTRNRSVEHTAHVIEIGLFLINQAYQM